MSKKQSIFFYILIGVLLQVILVRRQWIFGFGPDFLMCFLVVPTLIISDSYKYFLGAIIGTYLSQTVIGFSVFTSMISLFLIGILCIIIRKIINFDSIWAIIGASIIFTILDNTLKWLIHSVIQYNYTIGYVISNIKLQFLWHALIFVALYFIFKKNLKKNKRNGYMRWQ